MSEREKIDSSKSKDAFVDYVVMPWDVKTEMLFEGDLNRVTRWDFIKSQLEQKITNINQLIDVINSYNVVCNGNDRQMRPQWKFSALSRYFDEIDINEKNDFFRDGGILCTIINLALQGVELVSKVKLLKSGIRSCLTLHQLQIASLLANAFLCTYSERDAEYPSINFNKLFDGTDQGNSRPFIEKIKCIVHYFRRINEKQPSGNVSYYRLCINDHKLPRWDKTTAALCGLQVEIQGKIEDQEGFLQMDFANRFVGGGVLGRGCVQEEIRFVINPELIAARLFTQCLSDNEALFVVGTERYCNYTGFSETFRFDGDYRDKIPFDDTDHRKSYIIVLDALYFSHSSEQYRESKILRELKKAYVGFKPIGKSCSLPLATGNWGCGAFRGDPQLKSILQLMASSQARRNILYLTFGDSCLKKQIDDLYKLLKEREINVGTLYRIIRLYSRNKNRNQTLFDFIRDMIVNYEKNSDRVKSAIAASPASDTEKNVKSYEKYIAPPVSVMSHGSIEKKAPTYSVSDCDENTFLEEYETCKTDKTILGQVQIDSTLTDEDSNKCRDWIYDFGDCNSPTENFEEVELAAEEDKEMCEVHSSSLSSSTELNIRNSYRSDKSTYETNSGRLGRHKIQMNQFDDVKPKARKLIQPKITDCFLKK